MSGAVTLLSSLGSLSVRLFGTGADDLRYKSFLFISVWLEEKQQELGSKESETPKSILRLSLVLGPGWGGGGGGLGIKVGGGGGGGGGGLRYKSGRGDRCTF